jgi:hypothetical protein
LWDNFWCQIWAPRAREKCAAKPSKQSKTPSEIKQYPLRHMLVVVMKSTFIFVKRAYSNQIEAKNFVKLWRYEILIRKRSETSD